MSTNVINPEKVEDYLRGIAGGDKVLGDHLVTCLKKALLKEENYLEKVNALPKDAPSWLRQKWQSGGPWQQFVPDERLSQKVRYVRDWIGAAMANGEKWTTHVNEKGEPNILANTGTLAEATNRADKALKRLLQKLRIRLDAEQDPGTEMVMELDNGYKIVRMLTAEALDRESALMGHYIGGGYYDATLAAGGHAFYSLRDSRNGPHATVEVDVQTNTLLQCKGEEKKPPARQYSSYLQSFIEQKKFELEERAAHTGLIKDKKTGHYYNIYNLPEDLKLSGNLCLSGTQILSLPKGLEVEGDLDVRGTKITALPKGLKVGGNLYLEDSLVNILPEGLKVGGTIIGPEGQIVDSGGHLYNAMVQRGKSLERSGRT